MPISRDDTSAEGMEDDLSDHAGVWRRAAHLEVSGRGDGGTADVRALHDAGIVATPQDNPVAPAASAEL